MRLFIYQHVERFLGVITCTACANTYLFVNMGGEETQRMEFCFRVNKSCAFHVTMSWREQRSPLIQWKLTVYNCRVAANTIQETRTVRYLLFTIFYNAQDKLTIYTARNTQLLQGFLLAVIKPILESLSKRRSCQHGHRLRIHRCATRYTSPMISLSHGLRHFHTHFWQVHLFEFQYKCITEKCILPFYKRPGQKHYFICCLKCAGQLPFINICEPR